MTSGTPSSHFEKTPIAKSVEVAYPSVRAVVAGLVENRASPDVIRSSLIEHIALVNPKLAAEIMQAPTEGNVLKTIGSIAGVNERNNSAFSTEASNEDRYRKLA